MKWFQKINRGIILTVAVLLCVVGYLITLEISRNADKPKIEKICTGYIQAVTEYSMLPKESRVVGAKLSGQEAIDYINTAMEKIKGFYP